jgi:hypothetical protein
MPTAYPTALDALNNPSPSDSLDTPGVYHDFQHADTNDAIEALQAKVGINGSSVTSSLDYLVKKSGVTISPAAGVVPYTIRGAAGQTADLQKWQSSASVDLARINSLGQLYATSVFAGGSNYGSNLSVATGAANQVGAIVRGAASQTSSLQEFQNSAGSVLAKVRPDGSGHFNAITIGSNHAATQPANTDLWVFKTGTAMLRLSSGSNGGVINQFISDVDNNFVRGFMGSNAWWDTTNNVWTVENQGANDFAGLMFDNTGVMRIVNDTSTGTTPYTMTDAQMKAKTRIYVYNDGRVTIGGTDLVGQLHVEAQGDRRALSVEGFASGTAATLTVRTMGSSGPIQEWRAADDGIRSQVDANGNLLIRTTSNPGAALCAFAPSAASVGAIIRGFASQTADLIQAQNSSGAVTFKVGPNGHVSVATSSQFHSEAALSVASLAAAARVVVIRAAASQTGNLLEVQDSTGATSLMRVGSGGDVGTPSIANAAFTSPAIAFDTAAVRIFNRNAVANVPLRVDAMAGQTGDIQQWRNSAGSALAWVNSFGGIVTSSTLSTGPATTAGPQLDVGINTATPDRIGIVVKAAAAQTADLQQWRNSANAVLADVDSAGLITAPAFIPSGLTGATQASRYAGATTTGAPSSGTFAVGDWVIARDGTIWINTVAGTPGTWKQVSGGGGDTELLMYMGGF